MLQDYVKNTAKSAAGQILMGSFLLHKHRNDSYLVPTMAIGGELDGLNRVSRMMEEYYHRIAIAPDRQVAIATFPVIVVKGMNHYEFASGSMPLLVRDLGRDLKLTLMTLSPLL